MHVYYKFGLFLIFILSASTCYTRAAPATNQSSSYDDDYPDDYDYYEERETELQQTTPENRLYSTKPTTTFSTLINKIDAPRRSNHVLEPSCPKACFCLEDYKYIQCSNSHLTHVPHDIPSTALVIDLSHNHITELSPDDFTNCTKVREINLNGNSLKKIERQTFMGLRHLDRLYLANNQLTEIEPDTFNDASGLTTLDLSNNSIVLRNEGSFLNQSSLRELSCRNCSWTELHDDTFLDLNGLTALKLDSNNFNKKINAKAFTPLRNLIKLRLPELDEPSIQQLCNLLKSIDNISLKHFDISCFELVLGTSFNESLILATDPPYIQPVSEANGNRKPDTATAKPKQKTNSTLAQQHTAMSGAGEEHSFANYSLPTAGDGNSNNLTTIVLQAGVLDTPVTHQTDNEDGDKAYQVPVSQETINIMLIAIMIIAVIGIIIGIICRKDIGGIKTKCCRTRKPEPKDQVHPAEEIPLNKLA